MSMTEIESMIEHLASTREPTREELDAVVGTVIAEMRERVKEEIRFDGSETLQQIAAFDVLLRAAVLVVVAANKT